jgi:hypothetical protein
VFEVKGDSTNVDSNIGERGRCGGEVGEQE